MINKTELINFKLVRLGRSKLVWTDILLRSNRKSGFVSRTSLNTLSKQHHIIGCHYHDFKVNIFKSTTTPPQHNRFRLTPRIIDTIHKHVQICAAQSQCLQDSQVKWILGNPHYFRLRSHRQDRLHQLPPTPKLDCWPLWGVLPASLPLQ